MGTRIVSVGDIPSLPEAVEAHVPVFGTTGEAGAWPADASTLLPETDESAFRGLAETDPLADWQGLAAAGDLDRSSLLAPAAMQTIDRMTERDGTVELFIRRPGRPVTSVEMPRDAAAGLEAGHLLLGPSERLWENRTPLGFFKARVDFRPDQGSPPIDVKVFIPVLRLHCPRRPGCEATYAIERADGHEGSVELSVFGIGGGAGKSLTVSTSEEYSVRGHCIEIVVPATLRLQMGTTLANGTEVAYGMRAEISAVDRNALTERDVPDAEDACQHPPVLLPDALWSLDRREARGSADDLQWNERAVEATSQGKLAVALEIGTAPLKLGMDYVRRTARRTSVRTGVSPGARYAAYMSDAGGFEVYWMTQPPA
jgi:hypothetical protein